MDIEALEPEGKHVAETSGEAADTGEFGRIWYRSLDGGASRTERRAVQLVRAIRRILPICLIVLGDYLAIVASGEASILLRHVMAPGLFPLQFYPGLFVYSGLMTLSYAVVGLYAPIVSSGGPEELRRLTLTTTALVVVMGIVTYVSRERFDAGVWMFVFAWSLALFAVPLARALVRTVFSRFRWWGRHAIILGVTSRTTNRIAQAILRDPRLGLVPVATVTGEAPTGSDKAYGVPQLRGLGPVMEYQRKQDVDCAIVTLSLLESEEGPELIRRYETYFKHWLLVPSFPHGYSLWVKACDLNGTLALELTHRLLHKSDQIVKRAMDLVLTLIGGIVVLPLSLVIALAIRLDSRGPILYSQERIGKNGRPFPAFKFRSMVENADEILDKYLEQHPEFQKEWAETQKLKKDPRITRIGKFLRKTSLDELPQLLNVLRGEMSLVGPRPIVADEV
ncbi:MAG TPA: sugar transferase, partial [Gammaproteobacteria bacterium]|nr:sugar transferase [Gammaproteobacteria bacterium]